MNEAKTGKGHRNVTPIGPGGSISSKQMNDLLAELKKRPETPIQALHEDIAVIEGIIDILIVKGVTTVEEIREYGDRYQSSLSSLIMLCIEKGIFTEAELTMATMTFHHIIRVYGNGRGMTPEEILEARHAYLRRLLDLDPAITTGEAEDGG